MKECEQPHVVQVAADIVDEAIWKGLMEAKAKGDDLQVNLWLQLYRGQVNGRELDYRPEDIPDSHVSYDDDTLSGNPFGDDPIPGF